MVGTLCFDYLSHLLSQGALAFSGSSLVQSTLYPTVAIVDRQLSTFGNEYSTHNNIV